MTGLVFALSAGIGFVAGLRSMTAPAAVSWAVHLGWLHLDGSPLAFMGSTAAVAIFSVLALAEYVADVLPSTPNRTAPGPLMARIVIGGLCGACLSVSADLSGPAGAALGGIGAVIGAFVGYRVRKRLVTRLQVKDIVIAILEDLVSIGLACWIVSPQ
jgi:uncharacterized membrane protein